MNKYEPSSKSPYWGPTAKIVVGVAVVAAVSALVFYLRPIIGPLLLAFILSYLLFPIVERIHRISHLSWFLSVNLVYLILIVLILIFFAATGIALVQQVQSLIVIVTDAINNLPVFVENLSKQTIVFGPFQFNLKLINMNTLVKQGLDTVRPFIGPTGNILGTVAGQTLGFIGWMAFVFLISYFILSEARRTTKDATSPYLELPGYNYDFYRLSRELKRTWNAFLRGQIIIVIIAFIASSTMLTILGVRYSLAIGLLAGLARFVPYVGQGTNLIVTGLVCYFQASNYFGLDAPLYALLIIVCAVLLDTTLDNMIAPRIFGSSLGLHPAAILVTALISTRLIGFTGLILAAPVLATLQFLGRYVIRKMFNIDPWLEPDVDLPPIEYPWVSLLQRLKSLIRR
jgi:predicted PurR-regulated permease PerM